MISWKVDTAPENIPGENPANVCFRYNINQTHVRTKINQAILTSLFLVKTNLNQFVFLASNHNI
jgi:hypothetical protein